MKSKGSNKNKIIFVIAFSIVAIALILIFGLRPKDPSYIQETAKTQDVSTYYSFTGNVEAKEKQILISENIMQIKTIYIKEGDLVQKDDLLFETTQGQKIQSKIDGEVGEILVEEGAVLTPGTRITTITDYTNLQVTIKVDEYDIASMEVDKEVTVFINALDKEIKGKIAKVSKEAITVNGVSFFTAAIDLEKDPNVLVGMSTEVTMLSKNAPKATTISMKALQFDNENKPFVYYGNNGKVAMKSVEIGINDGNIVEITKGVKAGEVILLPNPKDNGIVTPFDMIRNP